MSRMGSQLFDGTSSECITGGDKNVEIVFNEPKANLKRNEYYYTTEYKKLVFQMHIYIVPTLAKFVDFPTPFTPQNVTTKGLPCRLASNASLNTST